MELEYYEIREDIFNMISNELKRNPIFKSCVARAIYENDYYISDEKPVEKSCYYIVIGAYTVETNNIKNLGSKVLDRIKQSYTQYLYKNETLLNFLDLTWEQCSLLGLESIYKPKSKEKIDRDYYKRNSRTKISKAKEKYKSELKAKGKLSKKEEIKQRRAKIKDLLEEGLKRKSICDTLSISIKIYKRDIQFLKEQGLI